MSATAFKRLLLSRWRLHTPCILLCLVACVPLLWPRLAVVDDGTIELSGYAGTLLFGALALSSAMMVINVVHLLLRLRNKRAFLYILAWATQWFLASLVFVLMAIAADVPPLPAEENTQPIQETDTLYPATEELTGPSALLIPIDPASHDAEWVEETPNLSFLEQEHEKLLADFLAASPRWAAQEDDAFYSRPGHVVMLPPATGGTPGLVHVCFRRLVEGDPLPQGYRVVKPGDPFPPAASAKEEVPDLALDLGRDHYLLLAWRGTSHRETAYKALNAAIAAVDSRMQELADSPTPETAAALTQGKLNMAGHTPELRLCEPPAQFGAYQAEIYANPGEPGTLLVYVRELESNRTLRILNCPARYSENKDELFRHDLPGSVPLWMRDGGFSSSRKLFAPETPLFAIKEGEPHHYFGVAFEVRFKPVDPRQQSRLILRRCYKVEAYEKPAPSEPRPTAGKRTPDELTPELALPGSRKPAADEKKAPPRPADKPAAEDIQPAPRSAAEEPTAQHEAPAAERPAPADGAAENEPEVKEQPAPEPQAAEPEPATEPAPDELPEPVTLEEIPLSGELAEEPEEPADAAPAAGENSPEPETPAEPEPAPAAEEAESPAEAEAA